MTEEKAYIAIIATCCFVILMLSMLLMKPPVQKPEKSLEYQVGFLETRNNLLTAEVTKLRQENLQLRVQMSVDLREQAEKQESP